MKIIGKASGSLFWLVVTTAALILLGAQIWSLVASLDRTDELERMSRQLDALEAKINAYDKLTAPDKVFVPDGEAAK